MKDSGSPPPPPDPTLTANAQSGANIQTAIANARLNRVNQSTPWGSISYTQGPPDANGVPSYSSQIQLSPMQQQLLEQQQQQSMMRAQIAQQILGNSGGSMGQPLDLADLPGVYSPTGGGHGTTWMGNPHSAPVGMAIPQVPPAAAPAPPPGSPPPATPGVTPGANPLAGNAQSPQAAALAQLLMSTRGNSSAAPTRGMNVNAGASGNPLDAMLAQNKGDLWGSSDGMLYQYGRDSMGRDTFGPGTAEDGTPLGNQDRSMIGSQDSRSEALKQALSKYGPNATQIRNTNIGGPGGVIDPSQVHYDPVAGLVTDSRNLNPMADDTTRNMMIVLAPAMAGMALGAASGAGLGAGYGESAGALAGGGGSVAGEGAGTGAFDVGGSSGFGGSTAINGGETALGGGEMPGYANEISAATQGAQVGAPVTDLSVQATQPSVWSQMLQNLQNGRGLLGMSPAQRTGLSLAAQMLMRKPQGSGGGK